MPDALTTRPVLDTDTPFLRGLVEGFSPEIAAGYGDSPEEQEERIKQLHIDNPNEHLIVDPAEGRAASVVYQPKRDSFEVRWLFPRAEWDAPSNLAPLTVILGEAIMEATDAHPWTNRTIIKAHFYDGRNGAGRPDGGKELCETWRDRVFVLGSTKANIEERDDGFWRIWWTVVAVRRVLAGLATP